MKKNNSDSPLKKQAEVSARRGQHIALSYVCFDMEDNELENSGGDFEIVIGEGALLPALENVLVGMKPGETKTVVLPPEKAFGPRDEDAQEFFPLEVCRASDDDESDENQEIVPGDTVMVCPDGNEEFLGVALSCEEDGVWVDMNHPMAGRTLKFVVSLVEILS